LRKIRDLLANAATEAGRDPATVKLLAVSKKQPLEAIREAIHAGQKDFGENYLQEGLEKVSELGSDDLTWHFIGHLQSNKTRAVAEHFDWVHTIDRLKVARRLAEQRPASRGPLNVCLQVDIDSEASKSGASVAAIPELARDVAALDGIRLRGLMCLPRQRNGFDAQREPFRRLRELFDDVRAAGIDVDTLSMGMTGDYRAAIAEGATIVRIGTAVFGPRN
jgi:pyridoxal phosphate enzyme (YggS family)